SSSQAYCTKPCPAGIDPYYHCVGSELEACNGATYYRGPCTQSSQRCEVTTRYGASCRGCGTLPVEGRCEPDGVLTVCLRSQVQSTVACVVQGKTCGWNPSACQYDCLGGPPQEPTPCASVGLTEGQSKCLTHPATRFISIQSCKGGAVVENECPAAGDGSVTCSETGGTAQCTTTCGPSGKRCTDRGVLATCDGSATLGWTDCVYLGGTCTDTGTDAYCACSGPLAAVTSRCVDGYHYTCSGGRIVQEACTCQAPSGATAPSSDFGQPCSAQKPCSTGPCVGVGGVYQCSKTCSKADATSCPSGYACTANAGSDSGVCIPSR
ncbi:MAG: hypothetical protein WCI05_18215, partial [Myxococcales bacterium]